MYSVSLSGSKWSIHTTHNFWKSDEFYLVPFLKEKITQPYGFKGDYGTWEALVI